jgi:hypothetical protein
MALNTHKPRPMVANGATVPACVGGLNVLDSLPAMSDKDAIILRNLIPASYGCTLREGYKLHSTGLSENVSTLMSWNAADGTNKLFAVDSTAIYDVSTPGVVLPTAEVFASANPWWQHTQFANSAGVHLIAFNGVDNGFCYNDTGYHALITGDGTAAYTWAGIDPKKLVNTVVHQKRIWAVEKDSTLGWYLPPEQIYGVAKSFNFGSCFGKGGFLQALATWTTDSGTGIDDKLLAISSRGEVAIYSGYDPEDATIWKLEGVFQAGATFSRRCWTKYGGDVAILTQYGVVTMSSLLSAEESVSANTISIKIQKLMSDLVEEGEYRAGWQILSYPNKDLLIINVPGLNISGNFQVVMNTITGAWTTFIGFNANCWHIYGSAIGYGGFQAVYRGLEGRLDNVALNGSGGQAIRGEVQQSFNYFDAQGQNKHYKMVRPSFVYGGDYKVNVKANMDFEFGGSPPPATPASARYGVWDEDIWDGGSVWSGGLLSSKNWIFVTGIGYAASIRMMVESAFELTWVSTDWAFEKGGIV